MTPHGLNKASSSNWKSPRAVIEQGHITLPGLCEWHAHHNPDYPMFRYADICGVKEIDYAHVWRAICRASSYIGSHTRHFEGRAPIAILANADTVTYCCTSLGIMQAGHTAFHISPRNGSAGVVDLLSRTQCRVMLVSPDIRASTLAQDVLRQIDVNLLPLPQFCDLFPPDSEKDQDEPQTSRRDDPQSPALILHSSGSTNHPKPIYWSQKRLVKFGTVSWHGEVDITGNVLGAHALPMFHAGGVAMCYTAICAGLILSVFEPSSPPTVPTSDNVFDGARSTSSDYLMTFPTFVEAWSQDADKVAHMKTMKGLMCGGAPLNQEVGDSLASQGISLITMYGCTEVGTISNFVPESPGMEWAYFRFAKWIDPVQVDQGDGTYELVVLSPQDCPLSVVNTKIGDQDAYATNDLVVRHPTKPDLWQLFGRKDDQIILSNGEKTNPTPIEHIIKEDPHVAGCIVFGQGKFQNGVLIDPAPDCHVSPGDQGSLVSYRNKIWPTIERANEFAPHHSRIFKEMILVTSPNKPLEYNAKGLPRRAPNLRQYHDEIEALYVEVERSAQTDIVAPATWDPETTRSFVDAVVEKVMQKRVPEYVDLFRHGCDSLQATWIRNTILHAIRGQSVEAAARIPMNIVFQAPTVMALTNAMLQALDSDRVHESTILDPITPDELVELAEQLSADLPDRPSQLSPPASNKDVVLITGTTGGFGCDVLEHLLRHDEVELVYAFNRPGVDVMERQRGRFVERGLDVGLLSSPKFQLVEAELDVPGFGIPTALLDEIRNRVTHIIHNAWKVDFKLGLSSFESDLQAVRNLVELSLSSRHTAPPKIVFISSVGVFSRCTMSPPIPEVPVEPSSAIESGYSASKWVAEKLLQNVSEHKGISTTIVRLGQVCGNRLGHWNEKEWFPAMIKSSLFTHSLPDVDGTASFIPSYPAARALVEMRNSTSPILHLVHPRPVSWHALITPIAEELRVPLVPYSTWLSALERSAADGFAANAEVDAMRQNPALRLLEFFRGQTVSAEKEAMGDVRLSTENAERASPELARLPRLGGDVSVSWVKAWRKSGFLPAA
ncbi:acetyl-CoA synthetase-like protein [Lentinus tigrinus ALCF2SS1-7]|uniref:Acetyl-CoA synthetase-like protein n=1 Tax=Lentinus tigrinus ALCF2SS1-6 TaxID=1328759 RepID=A0A5C2S005_9APHY|nr:acetyl-CoA synthetase-like protein [Lentinus tigrinus ALCF2SS1-6]RPD79510.1 acetyl-CoA synthetase-like protein [Lentinus tigrinus ALCF2SS1-7]